MDQIEQLIESNKTYAETAPKASGPIPARHIAVVTCMDARIDVFSVLGLSLGEVHIIRNAGARVTQDVMRSLALSSGVLEVDTVVVMQHTKCGLEGARDEDLRAQTGADLEFLTISDHEVALKTDIQMLLDASYLKSVKTFAGFVYDVESGLIQLVEIERQ